MEAVQQGVITLIKSAITGQALSLPEGLSLEKAEACTRGNSIQPMLYQGALNCGVSPKTEVMQRLQMQYYQNLVRSERQLYEIQRICNAFEENGIDYMPVKGCNMKHLYPQPELRIMGDADILIRVEQYNRIKPIMERLGFEEKVGAEHELVWCNKNLYLELHKSLIPQSNADLYRFFGVGWEKAQKGETYRYDLSREDTYIYLFAHMAKHFRWYGIGLRQIVDLYVYRRTYPDLDEERIETAMDELRLLRFYKNIRKLLAAWFEDAQTDAVTDCITSEVFGNGNWGSFENSPHAEILRAPKKGVHHVKWRYILTTVFPPMEVMRLRYPKLKKMPVLYPFYVVGRGGYYLLKKPQSITRKIAEIRTISDEKVATRQKMLMYMGLELSGDQSGHERA